MPILFKDQIADQAEYAVWKIEEDGDFFLSKLILSDWEQKYLDGIQHPERKLQWLASRYLLKNLMGTSQFVELLFDVYGKPFISNFDLNLSLSHSGDFAAAIISKSYEVGIDIEGPRKNIEKLKDKFLSPAEIEQIGDQHRMKKLLLYWSAKEVIYKIYGQRKLEFKDDMFVKPFIYQQRGELNGVLLKNGQVSDYLMHYGVEDEFVFVAGIAKEVSVIQD